MVLVIILVPVANGENLDSGGIGGSALNMNGGAGNINAPYSIE